MKCHALIVEADVFQPSADRVSVCLIYLGPRATISLLLTEAVVYRRMSGPDTKEQAMTASCVWDLF